ncbi:MAG: HAMP domain-containing sensor histidine kinase [Caulobacteraceae bacterium]
MFRSSSLRLAAFYALAFAVAVAILGAVTLTTTRAALGRQFDARIAAESASLAQEYKTEGLMGVVQAVRERDATPGALDFGLQTLPGARVAGRLAAVRAPKGWSVLREDEAREGLEQTRILATDLPGGYRLLVGDDVGRVDALDGVLFERFILAFAALVLLGAAGGYGLARGVSRRVDSITATAEAIIDGDLTRRVPARGAGDDLDRLAASFNRMLDRIGALMENLRQVSNDIAHELRTPLTRLRTRLEAGLTRTGEGNREAVLEAALADLDAILGAFAALLRISQIEAGARRAAFRSIDLTELASTVVEAFAPSAEDAGGSLSLKADAPLIIEGDAELLTQMLVNMVENALRHAGSGAAVVVACRRAGGAPALSVADNGPGVPAAEREALFDRFHRLEASRSTPGSGLGLALVAAVAKLHGAEASLHDAAPGLEVRVTFQKIAG